MTKRVRFAENAVVINSQRTFSLTTETDESSVYESFPIACFLTSSKMHGMLSDVWDEYKIEKVELSITRQGNQTVTEEESKEVYLKFFTCFDKNRPSVNISYSQIKTMDTYHETSFSILATNASPEHKICYMLGQKYSSTKSTPSLGTLTMGLASHEIFGDRTTTWWSCSFRFQVSYRVARVDTGYITTMIPSSVPEVSATTGGSTVICPPCPSPPDPVPLAIEIANIYAININLQWNSMTHVASDTAIKIYKGQWCFYIKESDTKYHTEYLLYEQASPGEYLELNVPAGSRYYKGTVPTYNCPIVFVFRTIDNIDILSMDTKNAGPGDSEEGDLIADVYTFYKPYFTFKKD